MVLPIGGFDKAEFTSWLSVKSPVYGAFAKKWRFRLGKDAAHVDISETKITYNARVGGDALAVDAYQAKREITTSKH